jgi:hypothetical protein
MRLLEIEPKTKKEFVNERLAGLPLRLAARRQKRQKKKMQAPAPGRLTGAASNTDFDFELGG